MKRLWVNSLSPTNPLNKGIIVKKVGLPSINSNIPHIIPVSESNKLNKVYNPLSLFSSQKTYQNYLNTKYPNGLNAPKTKLTQEIEKSKNNNFHSKKFVVPDRNNLKSNTKVVHKEDKPNAKDINVKHSDIKEDRTAQKLNEKVNKKVEVNIEKDHLIKKEEDKTTKSTSSLPRPVSNSAVPTIPKVSKAAIQAVSPPTNSPATPDSNTNKEISNISNINPTKSLVADKKTGIKSDNHKDSHIDDRLHSTSSHISHSNHKATKSKVSKVPKKVEDTLSHEKQHYNHIHNHNPNHNYKHFHSNLNHVTHPRMKKEKKIDANLVEDSQPEQRDFTEMPIKHTKSHSSNKKFELPISHTKAHLNNKKIELPINHNKQSHSNILELPIEKHNYHNHSHKHNHNTNTNNKTNNKPNKT